MPAGAASDAAKPYPIVLQDGMTRFYGHFFLRANRIFFICEKGFAFCNTFSQIFELAIFFCSRRNFAVSFGGLLVLRRVGDDFGLGKGSSHLIVPSFDLIKSFKHSVQWPVTGGQPLSLILM